MITESEVRAVKKLTLSQKRKLLVLFAAVALLAVIILIISGISKSAKRKKENALTGASFTSEGYEDVSEVTCLNEMIAVYTDASGKKGIMTLDGTITETASQTEVFLINDAWLSYKIAVKGPLSEYPLLVDTETGKITKKQYNGSTSPEKSPCWNPERNCLCWYNSEGYVSQVASTDVALPYGLYPVAGSDSGDAKYGYIDQDLKLAIDFEYDKAGSFSDGLAPVYKGGVWGYIDKTGNIRISFDYSSADADTAFSFKDGLVPVNRNGKYGIIDTDGETAVNFSFDKIIQGSGGKYIAKKDGKWGVLTVNEETYKAALAKSEKEKESEDIFNYVVSTAGSTLNIRSQPSVDSEKLGEIPNGAKIAVSQIENGWAYMTYGEYTGYVSANFIKPLTETPVTENTTAAPGNID